MPKSYDQKLRILYVWDYLQKNSHEKHPVSAAELIDMLQKYQISAERKSLYSDIQSLQEFGVDIITVKGKQGGYYIASGTFEPSELKLLVGAVQSSRYLTEKKSRELIKKLCQLCNTREAELVGRNVMVSDRVKSMNETILYSVDTIQEAIAANRQITFRYFDWGLDGKRKYREKEYIASPYGLYQDNENCYLMALSPRHGVTSYRLDRMESIQMLDAHREPCPELTGKALTEHAKSRFHMYSGEKTQVKLRFHLDLLSVVIDRFGKDIMMIPDGPEHFNFTVPVAVSPFFLSWVISFGTKAKILYPPAVAQQCKELCQTVMNQY